MSPDALVVTDADGQVVFVNTQTEAMFRLRRDQIVGKSVDELLPQSLRDKHRAHRRAYSENPTIRSMGAMLDLRAVRADGTEFPVEISLSPLMSENKVRFAASIRDVSERKMVDAQLAKQRIELLKNERLAAIGQMIAGIAHESRNGLQRTLACASLLEDCIPRGSQAAQLVRQIQQAQDEINQLHEDVRQYAAPIRTDRQNANLDEIVDTAWQDVRDTWHGPPATLRQHANRVDLRCEVDRLKITQVFRNVFENAVSASSDRINVDVVWEEAEVDSLPAIQIRIRDDGPGIPDERHDDVFTPFFTTKTTGTGLGLAICRRIVEAHGGRINTSARSDGAHGAEFVITLPR